MTMNKYIQEVVTEMYFDICDLSYGQTYKDIGYDNKKEFLAIMKSRLEELENRLVKEKIMEFEP
jgi:hypothetical protein